MSVNKITAEPMISSRNFRNHLMVERADKFEKDSTGLRGGDLMSVMSSLVLI